MRRLLAGYPNLGAHDPEGYIAALIRVMAEYPQWAGERTIIKVDDEHADFPPSDKRLRTWLDEAVGPYRFAAEWEARAKKQIEDSGPDLSRPIAEPQGRVVTYGEYQATNRKERPIGVFETENRKVSYRG